MNDLIVCVHFQHQEMAQHQKKLIPCLLGITRESIIKVDSNTKIILKTWPLSTVRRWNSSPNTFTLVIVNAICTVCNLTLSSLFVSEGLRWIFWVCLFCPDLWWRGHFQVDSRLCRHNYCTEKCSCSQSWLWGNYRWPYNGSTCWVSYVSYGMIQEEKTCFTKIVCISDNSKYGSYFCNSFVLALCYCRVHH